MEMELGGVRYRLDPAAISAIRYRAAYGESIVEALRRPMTTKQLEGVLLRMCHRMIPAAERPELLVLARQARKDGNFLTKGLRARDALLEADHALDGWEDGEESANEPFDEYRLLASLTLARVDLGLLYELPLLHLVGVVRRLVALQDPERKSYRKLTAKEMAQLYPRAKKKAARAGRQNLTRTAP
ncbi:hypothetical protein [Clostridium sp. J1101437_171009_A5]|uniref:hypothetical protein n=1 Tax=Clostridium sp. J1101437_171009_A5 TaxID=2787098 RepID=UPI000C75960D|nr:hypothetical protein [Clostridium sp. J1101437_171009_A5]